MVSKRAYLHHNLQQQTSVHDDWLRRRVKLVDVTFFPRGKEPYTERHVDDVSTLPETVKMSLDRGLAYAAVYPYGGRWCLAWPTHPDEDKRLRYYDNKEAAEMVAIHRGGR